MTAALLAGLLMPLLAGTPARAQLANTPWPMAHGNAQHTGRSAHVGPSSAPTVKWQVKFAFLRSSPVIDSDGTVYVSVRKTLYAFNPGDGSEKWASQLPATVRRNTAAIDTGDRIYIGARDNRLWALDSSDGSAIWSFNIGNDGDVNTSAAIAPGGTVYMAGTWNGIVHALAPATGALLWDLSSGGSVSYSSPALGPDGTVYVGTTRGRLRAVTPAGEFKWEAVVGRVRFGAAAVGSNGTVYIGSFDGLNAVDPDGTVLWTFDTEGRVASTPAIGADGTLYVGSLGRAGGRLAAFYAIDPDDGSELWRYQPDGSGNAFYGSPVIDANGDIYVASGNTLTSLDEDGDLRWEFVTGGRRNVVSTPAIAPDGTLYLAADDFYALED
jgi:outer membrane protein assembly factor BamB